MRIGLLGGSFDPPHVGHLLAASDAYEALRLDRLVFIPAAVQPLKIERKSAGAAQRLAMTKMLAGDDPRFDVDAIEIDRGGLSYTVDTLMALTLRWPSAELFWLVGADIVSSFNQWRQPDRIVELATVVVLERDGGGAGDGIGEAALPPGMRCLATRRIDVSSTEIRQRVKEGRSVRGFVPDAVADFIAAERLYR
jgi:nicotinate-nucleotide adenylyltransferase